MAGMIDLMKTIRDGARRGGGLRIAVGLASGFAVYAGAPNDASALPSFARQTGQTCSTCHTAFPQLTPYGRRFKLGGYTAGGGIDTQLPPISFMVQGSLTNLSQGLNGPGGAYAPPDPSAGGLGGFNNTNNWTDLGQQISVFYGGKIYGNLGAFMQWTYGQDYGRQVAWDNTDIRYADSTRINGVDVLWGVTFNNNPTVQDAWNTTPAWGSPFIGSPFAPGPGAATMLEGAYWGPGQVLGAGGYVFINDMFYAEVSGYAPTSRSLQWAVTGGPPSTPLNGVAPYWRVAFEPVWGEHSLMVGAYGMSASVLPGDVTGFGTDQITDTAFDAQYQWIGDIHNVTLRANYIYENQNLNSSYAQQLSNNQNNYLRSLKLSGEYVYKNTIAATATYFSITGSPDALIFPSNFNLSPNSAGWIFDLSYLPFSRGGPSFWPWANARVGLSYTLYTKFDGGTNNIDPTATDVNGNTLCPGIYCRSASNNNTLLAYAWLMW